MMNSPSDHDVNRVEHIISSTPLPGAKRNEKSEVEWA